MVLFTLLAADILESLTMYFSSNEKLTILTNENLMYIVLYLAWANPYLDRNHLYNQRDRQKSVYSSISSRPKWLFPLPNPLEWQGLKVATEN